MSYNYKKSGLIFNVGINDANIPVYTKINEKRIQDPAYRKWNAIFQRCYSESLHKKQMTYVGCSVCDEWLYFSNFREWYENQYKEEGWEIDKDLLFPGNKIYSPETCIMIPRKINSFMNDSVGLRGSGVIGATWDGVIGKYRARCNNPFTGKREYLGSFITELEAHLAWKRRKHELACCLADDISHIHNIAEALRIRYV